MGAHTYCNQVAGKQPRVALNSMRHTFYVVCHEKKRTGVELQVIVTVRSRFFRTGVAGFRSQAEKKKERAILCVTHALLWEMNVCGANTTYSLRHLLLFYTISTLLQPPLWNGFSCPTQSVIDMQHKQPPLSDGCSGPKESKVCSTSNPFCGTIARVILSS